MKYIVSIMLILTSCVKDNNHTMHDSIIEQDLINKQTELDILRELKIAQHNNDEEAFKFYVSEYVRVPRLKLTDQQKQHPSYKEWLSDEIIKSGEFMDQKYNYVD